MWVGPVFNLCMALLFAGYLLRAVRRFGRRVDAIMARMDSVQVEELSKYDDLRDEVRASMRAKVDEAIRELEASAPMSGNERSLENPQLLPSLSQSQVGGRTIASPVPTFVPDGWAQGPTAPRQTWQSGTIEGVRLTVETDDTVPDTT